MKYVICMVALLVAPLANAVEYEFHNVPLNDVVSELDPYLSSPLLVDTQYQDVPVVYSGNVFDELSAINALSVIASRHSLPFDPVVGFVLGVPDYTPEPPSSGGFMDNVAAEPVVCVTDVYAMRHVPPSSLRDVIASVAGKSDAACSSVEVFSGRLVVSRSEGHAGYAELIDTLDRPRDQVWLTADIVEVSEDAFDELGFSVGRVDGNSVIGGLGVSGLGQPLSSGLSFGLLSGGERRLVFQAIEQTGKARLLSSPSVVALSGSPASLSVGQDVPIVTGAYSLDENDAPFQTIERRSIGVMLDLLPVVMSDSVSLELGVESSSINESISATDVVFNESKVNTVVAIPPGKTLLVGGLVSENERTSVSGVPLLKDIPGVGRLFTRKTTNSDRRMLFVAITAKAI